jgi:DNA (cytosine-5)-methyltransferase 1
MEHQNGTQRHLKDKMTDSEAQHTELSLFSGAGGGLLASKYFLNWKTIGYVEYENYCQKVIKQRIKDGLLDAAPIFGDIRKFISEGYAELYKGKVDVVSGGFPCQDISCANPGGKGLNGERSGLWKSMFEIVCIIKPRFVFMENSPMLTIRGLGTILRELAKVGYNAKWQCMQASKIGANHKRDRIWLVAYSPCEYPYLCKEQGKHRTTQAQSGGLSCSNFWNKDWRERTVSYKPRFIRNPNGLARKLDRHKAIGNGQVPQVAATAWRLLTDSEAQ